MVTLGAVGGKWCSYIDFSHQDVSDAAQHGYKVKHIPGILEVVLRSKSCKSLVFTFSADI